MSVNGGFIYRGEKPGRLCASIAEHLRDAMRGQPKESIDVTFELVSPGVFAIDSTHNLEPLASLFGLESAK